MPRFRTIEVSDPPFESANLRYITIKTPNLVGRGDISVFVPKGAQEAGQPLPLVTLLHGVYGSHWVWSQKAGVHLTVQRMIDAGDIPPMLIAMPSDGLMFDGSAYLPHNDRKFDAWIVEDVPDAVIEAGIPTVADSPRFICGLSMGGYGALRLGAAHPDHFAAFAGHSSITDFDQMKLFVEEPDETYGQPTVERSVFQTLKQNADRLPPFRFDCGSDDLLIEHNRKLHADLDAAGIAHTYEEHPGGHEWPYWTKHIEDSLRFFAEQLD
ncbi:MAG: alpha/beta hydrolase-fold protein [Planctomycetota bacterium]